MRSWGVQMMCSLETTKVIPALFLMLATVGQFQNLETCCISEYLYNVMTVDPTYNIGKFNVTSATYHHLLLLLKNNRRAPYFHRASSR